MIAGLSFESLPPNWNSFDLVKFSTKKTLWDYQQEALKNAVKALWLYFDVTIDYDKNETLQTIKTENCFFNWYMDNGLEADISIKSEKVNLDIHRLLSATIQRTKEKSQYENFINRMSFGWLLAAENHLLL